MSLTELVDLALAITVVEAIIIYIWWRATGDGPAPLDWLPNLSAGVLLMVALRLVSVDAPVAWIVLCLSSSGVAHGVDLVRRWPRRRAVHTQRRQPGESANTQPTPSGELSPGTAP